MSLKFGFSDKQTTSLRTISALGLYVAGHRPYTSAPNDPIPLRSRASRKKYGRVIHRRREYDYDQKQKREDKKEEEEKIKWNASPPKRALWYEMRKRGAHAGMGEKHFASVILGPAADGIEGACLGRIGARHLLPLHNIVPRMLSPSSTDALPRREPEAARGHILSPGPRGSAPGVEDARLRDGEVSWDSIGYDASGVPCSKKVQKPQLHSIESLAAQSEPENPKMGAITERFGGDAATDHQLVHPHFASSLPLLLSSFNNELTSPFVWARGMFSITAAYGNFAATAKDSTENFDHGTRADWLRFSPTGAPFE
ncbi:hypothetical protein B0H19DRAFT_1071023 [Mycena capillaripes]|nr:hypothetical protein B0H19DRAFT_1071023 [Mycena capillaripes]